MIIAFKVKKGMKKKIDLFVYKLFSATSFGLKKVIHKNVGQPVTIDQVKSFAWFDKL